MKHSRMLFLWVLTFITVIGLLGCATKQRNKSKSSKKERKTTTRGMKVAFTYPVVMVNGKRAQQKEGEYIETIEMVYPENSVNDITLTVMDNDGNEKKIRGKIKTHKYSSYSNIPDLKPETVVISPNNSGVYSEIISNGYGELRITEFVKDPEKGEVKGPVLVELILGSKEKKNSKIEFRFREGSVSTIEGKRPPISLFFNEQTNNRFNFTIDEGMVKLLGELEVYKHNFYTKMAPVWVNIDESTKDRLRGKGGLAKIVVYVPSSDYTKSQSYITIPYSQDPISIAQRYGKIVGLLKIRRIR